MRWPLRNDKGEEVHIELKPQLSCNDFIVLVEAAVRGRGIALLPSIATQENCAAASWCPCCRNGSRPKASCTASTSRRGMMPAVPLLDFLSQRIPATYQRLERAPSPAVAAA